MEELFSNNILVIYIIACLAVISYTNFKENQRIFLLYLFTYGTAYFSVFSVRTSIPLLVIITFVFLEYLTEDGKKLELFIRISHKCLDYFFMMFFQYHFLWVLFAFMFLTVSRSDCIAHCLYFQLNDFKFSLLATLGNNETASSQVSINYDIFVSILWTISKLLSILFLWLGIHLTISQPFKIKSITKIVEKFEQIPIYKFEYHPEMQEKFDLLCDFEDTTYFLRSKSYSSFSWEYLKCILKKYGIQSVRSLSTVLKSDIGKKISIYALFLFLRRGHSTPEMQLLRTIGIVRGYDKYKYQRKVFEIVYSKVFFSALKEYHRANTYSSLQHYRHYLLFVYFQTILTKINGKRCLPLSSAFSNKNDIANWSMNGLFVACLGLSFREVNDFHLELFAQIINKYNLDSKKIKMLSDRYPEKFRPGDSLRQHVAIE